MVTPTRTLAHLRSIRLSAPCESVPATVHFLASQSLPFDGTVHRQGGHAYKVFPVEIVDYISTSCALILAFSLGVLEGLS